MWRTQVRDESAQEIATIAWAPMPQVDGVIGTYRQGNAEFIVRAVNSHGALVNALQAIVAADDAKSVNAIVEAMPMVRAALKLAEQL